MSKKGAFSIKFASQKTASGCISMRHDLREEEYLQQMINSANARDRSIVKDIIKERSKDNIYWQLNPGKQPEEYQRAAEERYKRAFGQKVQKGTMFIRPAILTIKKDTTIEQIMEMAKVVKEITDMTLVFAACHKDEGHYKQTKDGKVFVGNYHIHAYFLSQHLEDKVITDKQTGKTKVIKAGRTCRNIPFSILQDRLAPIFGMQRGEVKNNDPKAFLDPKAKFENARTQTAAQVIKAKAQRKEVEEQIKKGVEILEKQKVAINTNNKKLERQTQLIDPQIEGSLIERHELQKSILRLRNELFELQGDIKELENIKKYAKNHSNIEKKIENIKPKGVLKMYTSNDVNELKQSLISKCKETEALIATNDAETARRLAAEKENMELKAILNNTQLLELELNKRKTKEKYKFYEKVITNITHKQLSISEIEEDNGLKFIKLTNNEWLIINKIGNILTAKIDNVEKLNDCKPHFYKEIWHTIGNINNYTQAPKFKTENDKSESQSNQISL